MSKAPILILLIGLGGTVAFGILAHVAFSKNPTLQASTAYRQDVTKRFPVTDAEIRVQGGAFAVALTVDPARVSLPEESGFTRLPTEFESVARDLRESLPVQLGAGRLRLQLVGPSDFWGRHRTLWDQSSPTDTEIAGVEQLCTQRLGDSCRIEIQGPNALRVVSSAQRPRAAARELLPLVTDLGGGGWQRIEVSLGKLSFRFDGAGNSLP
ncbi:MAG: hypothetical protein AB7O52_09130 [Planctomycetota bacterium]